MKIMEIGSLLPDSSCLEIRGIETGPRRITLELASWPTAVEYDRMAGASKPSAPLFNDQYHPGEL